MASSTRRFRLVALIVLFGMICLVIAVSLDITFGIVTNTNWDKILECKRPFPTVKRGDVIFKGKRLSCDSAFVTGIVAVFMKLLKRNTDVDFSPILIIIVIIIGVSLYVPPILKKEYRSGRYIYVMELSFGVLAFTSFATFLVIDFALGEAQGQAANFINGIDASFPHITPETVLPMPICNFTGRGGPMNQNKNICMKEETWYVITLICVLNGENVLTQIGGFDSISENVKERNKKWTKNSLKFEGSRVSYSYGDLQTLGFCPWVGYRSTAAFLILLAIICFIAIVLLACFVKPTQVDPEDKQLPTSQKNLADGEDNTTSYIEEGSQTVPSPEHRNHDTRDQTPGQNTHISETPEATTGVSTSTQHQKGTDKPTSASVKQPKKKKNLNKLTSTEISDLDPGQNAQVPDIPEATSGVSTSTQHQKGSDKPTSASVKQVKKHKKVHSSIENSEQEGHEGEGKQKKGKADRPNSYEW